MKIILEECDRMKLQLPGLSLARVLYESLMQNKAEKLGT